MMATSMETKIARTLKRQGANDSLAEAIAGAAAETELNERQIQYDDVQGMVSSGAVYVSVSPVPDAVHDRLTEMGFEPMGAYDPHSNDGPTGCKYEDTRY